MDTRDTTPLEMVVIAAAREIRDGDIVFVGMRLPLLAFNLAKSLWAPSALGVFEAGLVRTKLCSEPVQTMCDLPFQTNASWATGLLEVMSYLQRGEVDLGIIGGAQIDLLGNVNSTLVNTASGVRRLPGSGGACDIALLAKKLVVIMPFEERRIRRRVDYVTSPSMSRSMNRGRQVILITDVGVFKTDGERKLRIHAVYPSVDLEKIRETAPYMIDSSLEVSTMKPPTDEEIATLRALDREGFWTRNRKA